MATTNSRRGGWGQFYPPTDIQHGFAVESVKAHDPLGDRLDAKGHLEPRLFEIRKFVCKSSRGRRGAWEQMWQDVGGHVQVQVSICSEQYPKRDPVEAALLPAQLAAAGERVTVRLRVENGYAFDIRTINFRLPLRIVPGEGIAVMDTYWGGNIRRLGGHGFGQCGGGGYSPLAVFFDSRSGEGMCVEYFDRLLRHAQSGVFWFADPAGFQPFLGYTLGLEKGKTADVVFCMTSYRQGLPEAALDDYRRQRLVPFMAGLGIPEAPPYETTGPWASSGWPFPKNDLVKDVAYCKSLGANGYIQWAPPDGQGYYEPFPERLEWFVQMKAASKLGIPVGVLINPWYSPRIDQSAAHWALDRKFVPNRVVPMAVARPEAQSFLYKMRDNLATNGVSVAYWDCGGYNGYNQQCNTTPEQYLTLLYQWKKAGIMIITEGAQDFTAWVTGATLGWYYGRAFPFGDPPRYPVLRRVTPHARMFRGGVGKVEQRAGRYWWDVLEDDGVSVPVLCVDANGELETWAKEHGRDKGM